MQDTPPFDVNPPEHREPQARPIASVRWPELPAEGELDIDAAFEQLDSAEDVRKETALQALLLWRRGLLDAAGLWRVAVRLERAESECLQQSETLFQIATRSTT